MNPTVDSLEPGTLLFGKWKVERLLGSGLGGCVYECRLAIPPFSHVALKLTSKTDPMGAQQIESLLKEYWYLSHFNHSHIVKGFGTIEDRTHFAFLMEYVHEGSLATHLSKNEKPSLNMMLGWLKDVAEALRVIHQAGFVHRDIKPENVLIARDLSAKLGDFGICSKPILLTNPDESQLVGSVDFIAPEYIVKGTYDSRSDIYAWGVLAHILVYGKAPFAGSVIDSLVRRASEDPMPSFEEYQSVPRPLQELIARCLKRNVIQRPQSALELITELNTIMLLNQVPTLFVQDTMRRTAQRNPFAF